MLLWELLSKFLFLTSKRGGVIRVISTFVVSVMGFSTDLELFKEFTNKYIKAQNSLYPLKVFLELKTFLTMKYLPAIAQSSVSSQGFIICVCKIN